MIEGVHRERKLLVYIDGKTGLPVVVQPRQIGSTWRSPISPAISGNRNRPEDGWALRLSSCKTRLVPPVDRH
jgi:hypothetical protein